LGLPFFIIFRAFRLVRAIRSCIQILSFILKMEPIPAISGAAPARVLLELSGVRVRAHAEDENNEGNERGVDDQNGEIAPLCRGTLTVALDGVRWTADIAESTPQNGVAPSSQFSRGFLVPFPVLMCHAVSRGNSESPACIYCQLDTDLPSAAGLSFDGATFLHELDQGFDREPASQPSEGESQSGKREAKFGPVSELFFVPEDAGDLERLYTAFCDGAEANPDPIVEGLDGEGGAMGLLDRLRVGSADGDVASGGLGGFFDGPVFTAENTVGMDSAEAAAALSAWDAKLEVSANMQRLADAAGDEDEEDVHDEPQVVDKYRRTS
jgi:Regulator of volume decrease after cellular swelling